MKLTSAGRWSVAALVVVIALIVALWPTRDSGSDGSGTDSTNKVDLMPLRTSAALPDCARPAATTTGPLTGITVTCLASGQPIDLGASLAGRPALVNLWAFWCEPCGTELPILTEYAKQAGDAIQVVTVHSAPDEGRALRRLQELGVNLPGYFDPAGAVLAAAAAPSVLPVSVLLRADGTIATTISRPFDSVADVSETVAAELGVTP